ncbi:MAG: hypothetical protein K6B44_13625 [Lachnospiraceae bacterium]|nr:hypothetical protein [Lachnospiraceae bacterium]
MKAKRVIAMLLSLSLIASVTACGKTEVSETIEETEEETKLAGLIDKAAGSHSSASGKDEVVYVLMDADGENENVIVSEQLKNGGGSAKVNDMTELSDISNVNGYGDYQKNEDGTITWEADGSDIFYRGTTDKELPVAVQVSYELDGQKVSAKDLAGKDGHVKIRLDYENRSKETVDVDGSEYEVSVPFVMVSGMILPNDTFSNVSVTNGKVIGEGNNEIVLGLAYPGLKESLDWDNTIAKAKDEEAKEKLEEINIPDYVEIEADAHDFELGMTMTLAGCDIFKQVDASDSVDLSGIQDKMDELGSGSKALVDGTSELKNGTSDLLSGTTDLKNGTAELANGSKELKDGTAELYNGTADLKNGTNDLKNGTAELRDGTGKLYQGADELKNGSGKLKNGAGDLKNGSNDLYEGSKSLKNGTEELYNGTKSLKEGTASLSAGSGSLYEGIVNYTNGAAGISSGAKQIAEGAAGAKSGADALKAGIDDNNLVAGASSLADGAGQISAGIDTLTQTLTGTTNASVEKMRNAAALTGNYADWMQAQLQSMAAGEGYSGNDDLAALSDQLQAAVNLSYEQCYGALALAAGGDSTECIKAITSCRTAAALYASIATELENSMAAVPGQIAPLKNGADQLAGGASQLAGGLKNLSDGVTQLDAGLDSLAQGAASLSTGADTLVQNNDALVRGAADLKEGAGKLDAGAGSVMDGAGKVNEGAAGISAGAGKLFEGSKSLYDGVDRLDSGVGSLKDGVAKINDGAGRLDSGAAKLNDGAFSLFAGAGKLNDGAGRLYEGAGKLDDGAGRLNDGAAKLDEGAAKLRDGMIKLDEEGIQKVTELLGDDATDVLNRFKAIRKAGETYTSFTGAIDEEGDSNSVRFIYKTGAVK